MTDAPTRVSLALLSHTNVGKTTLARTLLRQDIGAVMDRAHVTEVAESHVLMRSTTGDELVLWDTPGFGDSVRLLRRLERGSQPIGWFLSQVWDRLADRPFWCSQQAMRAARDSADVLLYVVNATEDPRSAGYVTPELRILRWLDRPALVLLNQLGTRADAAREAETLRRWREVVDAEASGVAQAVLSFDAFARCWLQEHVLLEAVATCLPPERAPGFVRLREAWLRRDLDVLEASAAVVAQQVAQLARDEEHVPESSMTDKLRRAARQVGAQDTARADPAEERARAALQQRLDTTVRQGTDELVRLHGLTGSAGEEILAGLGNEFATDRAPDPDRVGLFGGLVSGALSGLAADLATGGLTLGAGALLGGVAGALGARKLTKLYNAERGLDGSVVRWSDEFLAARLESALVRYLAVAHYGRGRGDFRQSEPDPRWRESARAAMDAHPQAVTALCGRSRLSPAEDANVSQVATLLRATFERLYPEASRHLANPGAGRQDG